jgi:uncharacterized membrane protein (DUF2068 family)
VAGKAKSGTWLVLIGVFKLLKAALLVILAIAALEIRHRDPTTPILAVARELHVDPDSRLVHWLVHQFAALSPHRLVLISIGTFVYAGLFVLEGVGLVLRKRWGEIVTIVITGSFIPWEIYEAVRRVSPIKLGLLVVNVAIVVYLVARVRSEGGVKNRRPSTAAPASASGSRAGVHPSS